MTQFIQGIDLNRMFYQQVVKPLLDTHFPKLKYAVGILGEGSDVMRFDTPLSMDHNWGPHLRLFLTEIDFSTLKDDIDTLFKHKLPYKFMGFPTNFTHPSNGYLVQQMKSIRSSPVNHLITFFTIKSFFRHYLGIDPYKKFKETDWLTFPQQALVEVTGGEVFYDKIGLEDMRRKFKYYPDDVWMYIYGMQWEYISNEQSFMGRSGEVGDELGSRIIANNICNNIIKLCFLMEKQYIPYIKWLGSAFSRLKSAVELYPLLMKVQETNSWTRREKVLGEVYSLIAHRHNELDITKKMHTVVTKGARPYKIIKAEEFSKEIYKNLKPPLSNLKYKIGAIDQFVSHTRINHMNYVYNEFREILSKIED